MLKIGIIGGGFSGIMAAVQLIRQTEIPLEILLFSNKYLAGGIAYSSYSNHHLLNVTAEKMSAFPDEPNDFLDWVKLQNPAGLPIDEAIIAQSYLPRNLYGDYLKDVWANALETAAQKSVFVSIITETVEQLQEVGDRLQVTANENRFLVDKCILATGNQLPRNPRIDNPQFYDSDKYFRNPWEKRSVSNLDQELPILLIGNGLTMADTVTGLLEQGFKGMIYSISPNGYYMLPHLHGGVRYTKAAEELQQAQSLRELIQVINKHVKLLRQYGFTAEPIADSLRPHLQQIWRRLSPSERQLFMNRLRHLWGVARHRIPQTTHDAIQRLRIDGKLRVYAGKINQLTDTQAAVEVQFFDKKARTAQTLLVGRVINCTGPESDLSKTESAFLKAGIKDGLLMQDELKLGILAHPDSYQVIDEAGNPSPKLYTIGSTLRGVLWESTAVNELRQQAQQLAQTLLSGAIKQQEAQHYMSDAQK